MCAQPRKPPETSRDQQQTVPQQQTAAVAITPPQPRTPDFIMRDAADVRKLMGSLGIKNPGPIRILNADAQINSVRGALAGTPVANLLGQPPPLVVQVSEATLTRMARGRDAYGYYMPNSNLILVSTAASATPQRLAEVTSHELTHYAAWRGHGFENIWNSAGKFYKPAWLEEGMANAISSGIAGGNERMAYPYETMAVVMLERIAGDAQIVRRAYVSGDFRALQQVIDQKLGAGTFERLVQFQDGAEASLYLMDAANKQPPPMDTNAYFADPRVVRAMASLMPPPGTREAMREGTPHRRR